MECKYSNKAIKQRITPSANRGPLPHTSKFICASVPCPVSRPGKELGGFERHLLTRVVGTSQFPRVTRVQSTNRKLLLLHMYLVHNACFIDILFETVVLKCIARLT